MADVDVDDEDAFLYGDEKGVHTDAELDRRPPHQWELSCRACLKWWSYAKPEYSGARGLLCMDSLATGVRSPELRACVLLIALNPMGT